MPENFTVQFNATQYDVTIELPYYQKSIPKDTYLFGVQLYINDNTLTKDDAFISNIKVYFLFSNSAPYKFDNSDNIYYYHLVIVEDVDVFNTIEVPAVVTSEKVDVGFHESTITTFTYANDVFSEAQSVNFTVNITMQSCNGSECVNGGTCVLENYQLLCECPFGYFGDTCEYVIDPCESEPCVNGNCSALSFTEYTCQCDPGFTGQNCTEVDDCVNIDCGNGTCIDLLNNYQCHCDPGYTDESCSSNIDDCVNINCGNGTCNDLVNDYQCQCDPGYTDESCSSNIDDCFDTDCGNGKCVDLINNYQCQCDPGYTDGSCSSNIDDCVDIDCGNGTCIDLVNGHHCRCDPDYAGETCAVTGNNLDTLNYSHKYFSCP